MAASPGREIRWFGVDGAYLSTDRDCYSDDRLTTVTGRAEDRPDMLDCLAVAYDGLIELTQRRLCLVGIRQVGDTTNDALILDFVEIED